MKIPIRPTPTGRRGIMSKLFRLPWLAPALVVVLVAGALGGVAVAQLDGGNEYSGCLSSGGSINKVALGSEPLMPCSDHQTEISWNQTGPPGPPGPSGLSQAFATGNEDTVFAPGDPPVDFMVLDLPAGNYVFNIDMTAYPELLFDEEGDPFPGPGGLVNCRMFEEAADGSRVDLTSIKVGDFAASVDGSEEGLENFAFTVPFPDHPENTRLVLVCQHEIDERVDILSAHWTAFAVDTLDIQPPPSS
jgi:hypothetical protein